MKSRILYGKFHEDLYNKDQLLFTFYKFEAISAGNIYGSEKLPPGFLEQLEYFKTKGFVVQTAGGFRISLKGKQLFLRGGFRKRKLRERLLFLAGLLATFSTIAGGLLLLF